MMQTPEEFVAILYHRTTTTLGVAEGLEFPMDQLKDDVVTEHLHKMGIQRQIIIQAAVELKRLIQMI